MSRRELAVGQVEPPPDPNARRGVGRPTLGGGIDEGEILDAAIGLFASKGYKGATLRDLAQAAGIRSGTLHHYYSSKSALYEAAFERAAALVYADFADAMVLHSTLAERVNALLLELVHPRAGRREGLRVIMRSWIDRDDSLQLSLRLPSIVEQTLEQMAGDAVANGEIRPADIPRLVAVFRAMAWGVVTLHLNDAPGSQAAMAIEGFSRSVGGTFFIASTSGDFPGISGEAADA